MPSVGMPIPHLFFSKRIKNVDQFYIISAIGGFFDRTIMFVQHNVKRNVYKVELSE